MKNATMTRSRGITYNPHALRVLEFDRVLEIVSSFAESEEGRSRLPELGPSGGVADIRARLEEVDECMQALRFDDPVPSLALRDIRDVFPLLRVDGYNLGIEGIAAVGDNLELARFVRRFFEERSAKYPVLWGIVREITCHENLEKRIRKVITPDLHVADDASPGLKSIRRKLARAKKSLRELVEKTLAALPDDVVAERLVTIRNNRFVIPVRDSKKNRVPGAVHDRSQTGRTLFIEPMASIEANNLVCELEMEEQAEINRILVELTREIASVADDIRLNQEILVRMDTIRAKARYGAAVDGVVPTVGEEPVINIRKGRHPLLDWKFRKEGGDRAVVPLDADIGGSVVTVVITGPNAGGKTVALKTVGLLTVMALSGLPVPAAENTSVFPPAGIFADIGDEQSIENDLSTFSSHMKQIVTVLREAGRNSLVLLDELGGGTNPRDGEAIALAVLKRLTERGALSMVTTHHDGLKVFAHETPGAINASMEFDDENLRPTFVYRPGVPGSSYAFEIAGRMGLPEDILKDAVVSAGDDRRGLEGLIAEMEVLVRGAEEERRAAQAERVKAESARGELERRLEDITRRREEILSEALDESRRILDDVNRRIESSIREIRETKASRKAIIDAKSTVNGLKDEIRRKAARIPSRKARRSRKAASDLKPGAAVWVESLGTRAEIVDVLDGAGKVRVRVGKSKASVLVDRGDLFEADHDEGKRPQVVRVRVSRPEVTSTEIDLRGMTFDEAREALDAFLDRLHLTGLETAHIIHGKGSGALRKKIGAYLEKHPHVSEFRLGDWNEGGMGVTVVTFKK